MSYNVKLDAFEGPFDLLLFLIHKNEIDIYNIPIAEITIQFVDYVERGDQINLEYAGEFLEMIAILMRIKTKMLLPQSPIEGEEEIEDPRTELVKRLIEYKQYKEASVELEKLAEDVAHYLPRTDFSFVAEISNEFVPEEGHAIDQISLYDLIRAYKSVIDALPKVIEHHVQLEHVSIEEQSEIILLEVSKRNIFYFSELFKKTTSKLIVVVSFIALLDLIRLNKVVIEQSDLFDDICIQSY